MADSERVLKLAAEIISAHATNNAVPSDQLPALIQQVFDSLATVEQRTAEPPKPDPAVPIGQSVRAGHMSAWHAASISQCSSAIWQPIID